MKLSCTFAVTLCLVGVAYGATFHAPSENPDHPGQCWIEEHKVAVKPEESYSALGNCFQYKCNKNLSYLGLPCSTNLVPPKDGCTYTPEDNTKLFPDCCPQEKC